MLAYRIFKHEYVTENSDSATGYVSQINTNEGLSK